jgi:fatty-acyl-CoA synthase
MSLVDDREVDAAGSMRLIGRIRGNDQYRQGRVASFEVEEVLRRHPQVAEAFMFGLPDPMWGEAVARLSVPRSGGPDARGTTRPHTGPALPGVCPKWIAVDGGLPFGAPGQVERRRLTELLVAGRLTVV